MGALLGAAIVLAACSTGAPRWFRGNLHTHSLWSDGNDFPEVIARWYKERDYDFLGISDHNTLHAGERWMQVDQVVRRGARVGVKRYRELFGRDWVEMRERDGKQEVRLRRLDEYRPLLEQPGQFLLIQSEEITDAFEKKPIHINATNVQEKITPQHGHSVRDVMRNNLRAVHAQSKRVGEPIVPHLNHPNFGWAVTAEDLAHVLEERFFEVYNGHPSVHQLGDELHASVERIWDIANTLRIAELDSPPLFGLATDDSHNYFNASGSTPGRGWVMVRARELTARAITNALIDGEFYASSGVTLDAVQFDGRDLQLRIRPRPGVTYRTEFRGTRRGYDRSRQPVEHEGKARADLTWRYSADVGAVLAVVEGLAPSYRLRGDELYVRAVVTASRAPDNPVWEGQRAQAWTQPVGWRETLGTVMLHGHAEVPPDPAR
ncbi:MAG: hypothetical protein NXI31_22895 [bacterium]|nr:hypothetical protein [bacterium]